MIKSSFNNIGIGSLAIAEVLRFSKKLTLPKVLLIVPFITHKDLLNYLGDEKVKIKSIEKLLIEKTSYFANFSERFYDSLCLTINSIQFLCEIDVLIWEKSELCINSPMPIDSSIGKRGKKICKAANNLAKLLYNKEENLYLNLRIKI